MNEVTKDQAVLLVVPFLTHPQACILRQGRIIAKAEWPAGIHEYDELLPAMERALQEAGIAWQTLAGIAVATGPWGFTATRTVTLTVNAIACVYPHLYIETLSLFDVLILLGNTYPLMLGANKGEVLIKTSPTSDARLIPVSELDPKIHYAGMAGAADLRATGIVVQCVCDWDALATNFVFGGKAGTRATPNYVKAPNITLPRHETPR